MFLLAMTFVYISNRKRAFWCVQINGMSEHNKNMTKSPIKMGLWFLFFLLYGITNLLHKEKRKMIKSINMHSIQKAKKQKDNRFLNKRREN